MRVFLLVMVLALIGFGVWAYAGPNWTCTQSKAHVLTHCRPDF
jgi:hypothetical protein